MTSPSDAAGTSDAVDVVVTPWVCPECGGPAMDDAGRFGVLPRLDHVRNGCAIGDAEDARLVADVHRARFVGGVFSRPATTTERLLLTDRGLPGAIVTTTLVDCGSEAIRRRYFPEVGDV